MAHMAQIQRERRTEAEVRAMDADDIVQWLHSLEDRLDEMKGERTELLEVLEGAVSKWERDAVIYKAMNAEYNPEPGWLIKARAAIAKAKGES